MSSETIKDVILEYNDIIEKSHKYNYLLRDSDLQREQIEILSKFKNKIKSIKYHFINEKDEVAANAFFHFQCVLNALIANFQIWIAIKENKYKESWDRLVDAQEYLEVAYRIDGDHYGIDELYQNLKDIERLIFPGYPLYNSGGFIEKGGKCSICGLRFRECEHLEGFVYMGKLCRKIERKFIKFDHQAMVKNPHDRRCTIEWISTDDGKKIDYITWKVTDEDVSGEDGEMTMGGVVLNTNVLDFD